MSDFLLYTGPDGSNRALNLDAVAHFREGPTSVIAVMLNGSEHHIPGINLQILTSHLPRYFNIVAAQA